MKKNQTRKKPQNWRFIFWNFLGYRCYCFSQITLPRLTNFFDKQASKFYKEELDDITIPQFPIPKNDDIDKDSASQKITKGFFSEMEQRIYKVEN